MSIRKYTPATPINHLAGDRFARVGDTLQQWRGLVLVATHNLAAMASEDLTQPEFVGTGKIAELFFEEHPVTAVAVTQTGVTLDGETYNFQFGPEGEPKTLAELASMRAELQSVEMAKKISMVNAYAKSNGGADMASMVGIATTIDFDANNPVSFSS